MRPDKQVKKEFLTTAQKNPEKFYATTVLEKKGYIRKNCTSCKRYFWTKKEDNKCGDSNCQGKISIFENNPSKKSLTFTQTWTTFKKHMEERGYTPIPRYPVVARWNPTTDFTMASIAAFQPYVISGEVQPPSKSLTIPQFCLRFGDIDNVGVTGSHCTGFVMIGQHQFVPPDEWDQNKAFEDLLTYLTELVGIPEEELTLHEDAWAGGGNYGPCMEFFSRGIELCNQVYMMYEQTSKGDKELAVKVLDMGLGQERVAWFTQGSPTIYDAAFPEVIKKLKKITNITFDEQLYKQFAPYSALLNLDEVEDIGKAWEEVSKKVGVTVKKLRTTIEPMKALYSIAEHSRALLIALSDGAIPGNVGGYYNLRVIYRRAQDFIQENNWNINLQEVVDWHAKELEEQYPELQENLEDVHNILAVEEKKYFENKKRGKKLVEQALKKTITTNTLINLYDSHGISPEQVRKTGKEIGITIEVPDNFYHLVSEKHEQAEQKTQTKVDIHLTANNLESTEQVFYEGYDIALGTAKVLHIDGNHVVLDKTIFYPTSGGQEHDLGTINNEEVVDVKKKGKHIIHILKNKPKFKEGSNVELEIDIDRRIQLAQHHTAAHVINGAARNVLGNHIWQAGAAKTVAKGRLDITHFDALSQEEMNKIETVANDIVRKNFPVIKQEMKKNIAEQEHGFRLYQGGAVPGNMIRVIDIPGFDTEACGGTHVHTTGELQVIKLLKSTKVQDGVVRVEYVAGKAAIDLLGKRKKLLTDSMELLGISDDQLLVPRVEELFTKWKKVKKLKKKKVSIPEELSSLVAKPKKTLDALAEAADALSVQEEHLPRTIKRFLDDWNS